MGILGPGTWAPPLGPLPIDLTHHISHPGLKGKNSKSSGFTGGKKQIKSACQYRKSRSILFMLMLTVDSLLTDTSIRRTPP